MITRTYAPGWGFGGTLTAAQLNALDLSMCDRIDDRQGEVDHVGSIIGATGPSGMSATGYSGISGRILPTVQTGPDASVTFYAPGHNSFVAIPTLTSARTYTLGYSGATGGDRIFFYMVGTGSTASGYVDITNPVGTAIFRLGVTPGYEPSGIPGSSWSVDGDWCEAMFVTAGSPTGWVISQGQNSTLVRGFEFTATTATVWTCPPDVYSVMLHGWGGGGGGAGGNFAWNGPWDQSGGGGGGGGAIASFRRVSVVPGRTYEGLAGGGGAAGRAGTPGSPVGSAAGGAGGDSIFREKVSGNVLETFRGAEGGWPSAAPDIGGASGLDILIDIGFGGRSVRPTTTGVGTFAGTAACPTGLYAVLGNFYSSNNGGLGATVVAANAVLQSQHGRGSFGGYAGGRAGTNGGVASGSQFGGGPGGGGGGGPNGDGGAGGNGAAAQSGATGNNGSNGSSAANNSGAGGGGGGGGGVGSSNGGNGGVGGAGGTGKIILTF